MEQQIIVKLCHTIKCRSVEPLWIDVSMSMELSLVNISPITSYPIII